MTQEQLQLLNNYSAIALSFLCILAIILIIVSVAMELYLQLKDRSLEGAMVDFAADEELREIVKKNFEDLTDEDKEKLKAGVKKHKKVLKQLFKN